LLKKSNKDLGNKIAFVGQKKFIFQKNRKNGSLRAFFSVAVFPSSLCRCGKIH
jgi:hypothetical protein